MSEATPPWRVFSSESSDTAATPSGPADRRALPGWLVPALAGIGGLGLLVAMAGMALLAMGTLSDSEAAFPAPASLGSLPAMEGSGAETAAPAAIVVDVAGAVVRPGLHRLRGGDRVGDAIEAAGGFAPRADLATSAVVLNLAQPLEDGAKVLVPELGIDRPTSAASAADGRIDLNRASASELESLPGIGPVTAGKIIDAREAERFGSVRELRSRGIVGEKVYEDIERLVTAS